MKSTLILFCYIYEMSAQWMQEKEEKCCQKSKSVPSCIPTCKCALECLLLVLFADKSKYGSTGCGVFKQGI